MPKHEPARDTYCPQCCKWQFRTDFDVNKRNGNPYRQCRKCRSKYGKWAKMSAAEKLASTDRRAGLTEEPRGQRFKFTMASQNRKVGAIPMTASAPSTCPKTCALYGAGCYGEDFLTAMHWRRLARGEGLTWAEFIERIRTIRKGQLWRHNEVGDLAGVDEKVDRERLWELARAADGTRGFTYTHKRDAMKMMADVTGLGFTINLSCDSLSEVDQLSNAGLPLVVTLPSTAKIRGNKTPGGISIVVCPAEYKDDKTCANCGLCYDARRSFAIGFRAHGNNKLIISERLEPKRQLPLFKE